MTLHDVERSITLDTPTAWTLQCSKALAHSPLFQGLDDAKLRQFISLCQRETWSKGNPNLNRDSTLVRFRVLISGRMKLTRSHPDSGREITLLMLGPGDAYGVNQLLGIPSSNQDLNAVALDYLEMLSVALPECRVWMRHNREFIAAFLPYLNHQLQQVLKLATDLSLYDTEIRLLKLLARHDPRINGERCPLAINDLSHEELASLIGSVRAVVNRHLQDLKQRGILMPRRGNLQVNDVTALSEQIADFIDSRYRVSQPSRRH